jgi:hypothetical protein
MQAAHSNGLGNLAGGGVVSQRTQDLVDNFITIRVFLKITEDSQN